jgi:transcriptional regulator with GAF, ATPase, and Fis domain
MDEILNIDYHTRIYVMYALKKYNSPTIAAKHLGITARTIHRYINKWGITYNPERAPKTVKPVQWTNIR